MPPYVLLAVLVALLVGLIVGKAWERYKLRDGRWIDRRRLRETPHYMLGLNFLAEQQVDAALDALTQAIGIGNEALEIQMILGNLYRQKGQVGRAITIHQRLLQRASLTRLEHAYVLLCLGLDYRTGGFVDRALEAFQEVLRLDPDNRYALTHLQKVYEDQQQWADALATRERIAVGESSPDEGNRQVLAFLRYEIGRREASTGDTIAASRAFESAIETDARTAPAYLHLGDLREQEGRMPMAVEAWERFVAALPDRAYLAFDRLSRGYAAVGTPERFVALCTQLIGASPQDWRARLALADHLMADGDQARAFEVLLDALPHNPHGLAIHQAVWRALAGLGLDAARVDRYVALMRHAVFYLDPHVCVSCRYRSTELLWQCPQCHEWNTFVEERIAPAQERSGATAPEA